MTLSPDDRARRRKIRAALATLIMVAWAGALGGLVKRDIIKTPAQRLAEMARRVNPGNVFYTVEREGRRVGWASSTVDTLIDTLTHRVLDTLSLLQELIVDLPHEGTMQRMGMRSQIMLSRTFALRRFVVDIDTNGTSTRVTGQAESDTIISYVVETNGRAADTQRVTVPAPVLLPQTVPLATILGAQPKVGRRATYHTFDPATQRTRDLTMAILAESLFTVDDSAKMDPSTKRWVPALRDTIRAWHVGPTEGNGPSGWFDAQGQIVDASQLPGLHQRRLVYEISFENWRLDGVAAKAVTTERDVVSASVIEAGVSLKGMSISELKTRLVAPTLRRFDLAGGRQTLDGNVVTVRVEDPQTFIATYKLPADGTFRRQNEAFLRNEPGIETGAPPVLSKVIRVVGVERDPVTLVRQVTKWIADSVKRAVVTGQPGALRTVLAMRGDVTEHAQLFAAFTRTLGIPTRTVAGVLRAGNAFHLHAWAEVYLGDWVAVDPTLGQFPADANHIRLMTGRLDRPAELLNLLATLHLEVLEAR